MIQLWWTSEDRQGEIAMGEYSTPEAARAAIPEAQAELLRECFDDAEDPTGEDGLMTRSACLAGTWWISEEREDN